MTPSIAPLRNVASFTSLVERVTNRTFGLEAMAVFHGRSGEGKTFAVTFASNEYQAHCVQVKSCWNPSYLLKKTLTELGVKKPRGTNPDLADQVAEKLMLSGRPLIIDDAQYLLKRQMIDIVRDIYESCKCPIILVGEQELPQHLTKHENIHNRQMAWVEAVPCNMRDAKLLARIYARDTTITDDLLQIIVEASDGVARRISHNIAEAQELARSKGRKTIDPELWGDRPMHTGQPPVVARRIPALTPPDAPTVRPMKRRAS